MSTTITVHETPPLERATDRLERSAGTAQACFDDLAAPGWDSFRRSRARFLDPPAALASEQVEHGLPRERLDGG